MRYRAALLIGLMTAAGCGTKYENAGGQVPASGVVVDSAGKPVANADLRFYPTEPGKNNGTATTGPSGKFTAKTSDTVDGLIPGKYKVTVAARGAKGAAPVKLNSKYAEEDSTDLLVQVESGKELRIELK